MDQVNIIIIFVYQELCISSTLYHDVIFIQDSFQSVLADIGYTTYRPIYIYMYANDEWHTHLVHDLKQHTNT